MRTVNLDEAKRHLSRLVDRAARGESFVIAKAGKPLVKVTPMESPVKARRLGFMRGEIKVPNDFDRMARAQIATFFGIPK